MLYRIMIRYEDENKNLTEWIDKVDTAEDSWELVTGESDKEKLITIIKADIKWYGSWIIREQPGEFIMYAYVEKSDGGKYNYIGHSRWFYEKDDPEYPSNDGEPLITLINENIKEK